MLSLREKMAHFGFESNDEYEFQVSCLLEGPADQIRTLDIAGDSGRRKTAFATALAHALEQRHVLYHDFTEHSPPPPEVILPPSRDELGREEPPIERLDQVVSEVCALSEAESTVLILDQLQAADFREHLRISRLICDRVWAFRDARYHANPKNLLLFLISELPLYHSLQKVSFRVWVGRVSERRIDYMPEELGLGPEAAPVLAALAALFRHLGAAPTRSEVERIIRDMQLRVRSERDLADSLYGWSEAVDRERLRAEATLPFLTRVLHEIETWLGAEVVELGGEE